MKATIAVLALLAGCAAVGPQPDRVVYHLSEGLPQASNGLRNIGNHLEVNPSARIVVVSHARGVDFLMKDAKDANGNPFEVTVQDLVSKGVRFDACAFTLQSRNLDPKTALIEEAKIVPSGVAEVARLQAREGYVYLKP